MRKFIACVLGLALALTLAQCRSKEQKDIIGVWQLQQMTVNGTTLPGNAMGNWLWEFNGAGGYLTDVAGVRQKGLYMLKSGQLSLQLGKNKDKPAQVYQVLKLDTVEMDLQSTEAQNKSSLRFIKRSAGDVNQEKD